MRHPAGSGAEAAAIRVPGSPVGLQAHGGRRERGREPWRPRVMSSQGRGGAHRRPEASRPLRVATTTVGSATPAAAPNRPGCPRSSWESGAAVPFSRGRHGAEPEPPSTGLDARVRLATHYAVFGRCVRHPSGEPYAGLCPCWPGACDAPAERWPRTGAARPATTAWGLRSGEQCPFAVAKNGAARLAATAAATVLARARAAVAKNGVSVWLQQQWTLPRRGGDLQQQREQPVPRWCPRTAAVRLGTQQRQLLPTGSSAATR